MNTHHVRFMLRRYTLRQMCRVTSSARTPGPRAVIEKSLSWHTIRALCVHGTIIINSYILDNEPIRAWDLPPEMKTKYCRFEKDWLSTEYESYTYCKISSAYKNRTQTRCNCRQTKINRSVFRKWAVSTRFKQNL